MKRRIFLITVVIFGVYFLFPSKCIIGSVLEEGLRLGKTGAWCEVFSPEGYKRAWIPPRTGVQTTTIELRTLKGRVTYNGKEVGAIEFNTPFELFIKNSSTEDVKHITQPPGTLLFGEDFYRFFPNKTIQDLLKEGIIKGTLQPVSQSSSNSSTTTPQIMTQSISPNQEFPKTFQQMLNQINQEIATIEKFLQKGRIEEAIYKTLVEEEQNLLNFKSFLEKILDNWKKFNWQI